MSAPPSTSAAPRPLRVRLWRRRIFWAYLILGSFLFSLIAVVLIGGTRLSQYERNVMAAATALADTPTWCTNLDEARALPSRSLESSGAFDFPRGPTWWLALQWQALAGQASADLIGGRYASALRGAQSHCPYEGEAALVLPSTACGGGADADALVCERWTNTLVRSTFSTSQAAAVASAAMQDARSSAPLIGAVLRRGVDTFSKKTRAPKWQHWRDVNGLKKELAAFIDNAFTLTEMLPPAERRTLMFTALQDDAFVDDQISGTIRLHFAQTPPLVDCISLMALAAGTRRDALDKLDWATMPTLMRKTLHGASQTETAQAASKALSKNKCSAVVDFVDEAERPCAALRMLSQTLRSPRTTQGLARRYACPSADTP